MSNAPTTKCSNPALRRYPLEKRRLVGKPPAKQPFFALIPEAVPSCHVTRTSCTGLRFRYAPLQLLYTGSSRRAPVSQPSPLGDVFRSVSPPCQPRVSFGAHSS
jgi:hypothetical protein